MTARGKEKIENKLLELGGHYRLSIDTIRHSYTIVQRSCLVAMREQRMCNVIVTSFDDLPRALTVSEAVAILRIGRNTAYELVCCGKSAASGWGASFASRNRR